RVEFWCALRRHSRSYGNLQLTKVERERAITGGTTFLSGNLGNCELTRAPSRQREPSGAARILEFPSVHSETSSLYTLKHCTRCPALPIAALNVSVRGFWHIRPCRRLVAWRVRQCDC